MPSVNFSRCGLLQPSSKDDVSSMARVPAPRAAETAPRTGAESGAGRRRAGPRLGASGSSRHAGSCSSRCLRERRRGDGRPGPVWPQWLLWALVPAARRCAQQHTARTPPPLRLDPPDPPLPAAQAGAGLCAVRPMGTEPGSRGVAASARRPEWRLFQDGGRGGPLPPGRRGVLEPGLYPLPGWQGAPSPSPGRGASGRVGLWVARGSAI